MKAFQIDDDTKFICIKMSCEIYFLGECFGRRNDSLLRQKVFLIAEKLGKSIWKRSDVSLAYLCRVFAFHMNEENLRRKL